MQLTNSVFLGFSLSQLSPFQNYTLMKITSFSVRLLALMNLLWPLIIVASAGPNRIEYILIVKLSLSTKLILLDLLNEIYSLSVYILQRGRQVLRFSLIRRIVMEFDSSR